MCLVSNVQLTEVIIVFPSNKCVAMTRAGLCVVYVVDYPESSIRYIFFHKVVQQHYSGEVSEFTISEVKFPQGSVHQKLLKLVHSPSYSKYKRGTF